MKYEPAYTIYNTTYLLDTGMYMVDVCLINKLIFLMLEIAYN